MSMGLDVLVTRFFLVCLQPIEIAAMEKCQSICGKLKRFDFFAVNRGRPMSTVVHLASGGGKAAEWCDGGVMCIIVHRPTIEPARNHLV